MLVVLIPCFLLWIISGYGMFVYFKIKNIKSDFLYGSDIESMLFCMLLGPILLVFHLITVYIIKPLYNLSDIIKEFSEYKKK